MQNETDSLLKTASKPEYTLEIKQSAKGDVYGGFTVTGATIEEIERKTAEMVAIPTGIGALMMKAESLIRVDTIMACLLVLSIMCLGFERFFLFLENISSERWRRYADHRTA